jgi:hypothetical protein
MQPENSVQAMAMIKPRSEVDFENATVGDVMRGDVLKARFQERALPIKRAVIRVGLLTSGLGLSRRGTQRKL